MRGFLGGAGIITVAFAVITAGPGFRFGQYSGGSRMTFLQRFGGLLFLCALGGKAVFAFDGCGIYNLRGSFGDAGKRTRYAQTMPTAVVVTNAPTPQCGTTPCSQPTGSSRPTTITAPGTA